MMKVLIAVASLIALVSGQATELTNMLELDEANPGNFRLYWEVLEGPASIVYQIQANCSGWVSLLIASADGSYADVFLGGHDDELDDSYGGDFNVALTSSGHGGPAQDASNDVVLQGSVYADHGATIIRVKRQLNTGDREDVPIIRGEMNVGWSYHKTSDSAAEPHTDFGFTTVTFRP